MVANSQQPGDDPEAIAKERARIAELLEKHENFVWWVARRVSPPGITKNKAALEDVASEVRLQLVKAASMYDGESAKFTTYVKRLAFLYGARAVRVELNRGIKVPQYQITEYRPPEFSPIHEPQPGFDRVTDLPAPTNDGVFELPPEFWDKVKSLLTPNEFKLLTLITNGKTMLDASAELGFHRHTGEKMMDTIKAVLRGKSDELDNYLGEV